MSSDEDEASAHLVAAVRLAEAGAATRVHGDEKKAKKRYRKAVKQAAAACTSGAAAAAALAEDLLTRVEHNAADATAPLPELRATIEDLDDAVTALAAGGVCLLQACVEVSDPSGLEAGATSVVQIVHRATMDQFSEDDHFSYREVAMRCRGRIDLCGNQPVRRVHPTILQ